MSRSTIRAGLAYATIVFGAGVVLGTFRNLLLVPRFGEIASVLLELPLMLAVSWWVAGVVVRRFRVPARAMQRIAMGGVALVALWIAEAALLALLGTPLAQIPAAFVAGGGAVGLAGQIVFATFPLLRLSRRR